jgi:hypothetical protein
VATLFTCAVFATATGIVGAVVTLMGLLAFPQMLKGGYDVRLSAGAITAGGCLGILIPPSVLLIVYGATAGVSVVQLYAGAFFPGIMLAGLYILYVIILAKLKPALAPPLSAEARHITLPPMTQRISDAVSNRALPALLRRSRDRRISKFQPATSCVSWASRCCPPFSLCSWLASPTEVPRHHSTRWWSRHLGTAACRCRVADSRNLPAPGVACKNHPQPQAGCRNRRPPPEGCRSPRPNRAA